MASRHLRGWVRLGAACSVWDLANLRMARASPRVSSLSVRYKLFNHGRFPAAMSSAHALAAERMVAEGTMSSTKPSRLPSSAVMGFERCRRRANGQDMCIGVLGCRFSTSLVIHGVPASYQWLSGDQQASAAAVCLHYKRSGIEKTADVKAACRRQLSSIPPNPGIIPS